MPSTATITAFYSFTALTTVRSSLVNSNFSTFRGHFIPIDTDTATSSNLTHDLGADGHSWRGVYGQYGIFYANTTGSVPAAPSSGKMALYFKDNGNLYKKNSSGTETQLDAAPAAGNYAVTSTSASYTATTSDNFIACNANGGAITITLYTAVGNSGRQLLVKKTDSSANAVTVDGNSSETIDGATTYAITIQYESITIISDGSNWHII